MSIAADQVSSLSIIFMVLTGVIVFAFPIGLAVWAKRRYRAAFSFIPLLGGVLAFFISQEIIRLPIVQLLLPTLPWFQSLMKVSWAYFLFMSFTAGLVEEPARYIVFSILKQRRSFTDGLSYGIGHGGIEAILLVGITYISNLFLSLAINSGNLGALGSQLPSTVISALTDTPSYLFAVAGIERIFAIALQIALSLLVLKGFQVNKKGLYLLLAFLIHGLVNFLALTLANLGSKLIPASPQLGGVLASEVFILIIAILSLVFILWQAKTWQSEQVPPPQPPVTPEDSPA